MKHAKSFLPKETLKTMYTSIVEPHFRYCCSVWGCCGLTKIKRLQKPENRAARIVSGSSFDTPSQPLIKELGWRTIDELITSESNIIVFKSIHGLARQYMCDLFTEKSKLNSRNLRNTSTDLSLQKKNFKNGHKCYSFRGARPFS